VAQKPDICIIYNPFAGRGRAAGLWRQIALELGSSARLLPTQSPGHGLELARQASLQGFATVAAAGGDGTVHEVINGIVAAKNPNVAFAVLPLGSGNDYARMVGAPLKPEEMIRRLLSDQVWAVDIGQVILDGNPPHYFCNTLGLGLSGAVTWEAKKIRWLRGISLYGLAAIKSIYRHFRSVPIQVTEDGCTNESHLLYMAVALGRAEGGGFVVAPQAELDDGWFDLLHATRLSRWQALGYLPKMVSGNLPADCEVIQRRRVRGLTIRSELPIPVHADGELLATPAAGARICEITLLPGALKVRGQRPL
jgi:YegS/Rv2252/BmrU family lipid kinase